MTKDFNNLNDASHYTNERLETLRSKVTEIINTDALAICVVGSYGRREASPQSDLDFFFLRDGRRNCDKEIRAFRKLLRSERIKMPSRDGAFNSYTESFDGIARDIGGLDDSTEKLTRRLLFLLEGDYLYNRALFNRCLSKLIEHYVRKTITEHQLCKFLLNDLIRYYRTICVDFECKTHQDGKSWGDRNIKLQFSRKLLYFSGILVVAETWQSGWKIKRDILSKYLKQTPIERVRNICGTKAAPALQLYDRFLDKMADPHTRKMLEGTTDDRKLHGPEFRQFKNEGHHFTMELSRLLASTYDAAHPIHMAIKF